MPNLYRSNLENRTEVDSLTITTQPTTTSYILGDSFDPTGMVVYATAGNLSGDVTQYCTFSPLVFETLGTQTVTINYMGRTTTTTVSVSDVSISITSPPTQTEFEKGDTLDLTGIVVTAMDGQRTKDVTSRCSFSPANGSILTTTGTVAVTATYYGHTASTNISVISSLVGISITTPPTKVIYNSGDALDLTGIVVTADYDDYTEDVTTQCTFNPTDGTIITSSGTITATFRNKTATTGYYIVSGNLESNDWRVIKSIGAQGIGSQLWSIGDTKTITLNGKIGDYLTLSNYACKVFIIDFNHDNVNGIYFQGFMTSSNTRIALADSNYNTSKTLGQITFNLMHWANGSAPYASNYGGWKGCDLRYDILGSTNQEPSGYGSVATTSRYGYNATENAKTNPKSDTLMAAIPSDLRNALAQMTVYTDNVGNKGTASSNVTASIDYFILPAPYELYGTTNNFQNEYEINRQSQFAYYLGSDNSKKVFYNWNDTSTASLYWTRSPYKSGSSSFCYINASGATATTDSKAVKSVAPIFRVA